MAPKLTMRDLRAAKKIASTIDELKNLADAIDEVDMALDEMAIDAVKTAGRRTAQTSDPETNEILKKFIDVSNQLEEAKRVVAQLEKEKSSLAGVLMPMLKKLGETVVKWQDKFIAVVRPTGSATPSYKTLFTNLLGKVNGATRKVMEAALAEAKAEAGNKIKPEQLIISDKEITARHRAAIRNRRNRI